MNGHLLRSAIAAALVLLTLATDALATDALATGALATGAMAATAESAVIERFASINREALAKYEAGHFDEAARLLRDAVAAATRALGRDQSETLALTNNLAAVLHAKGRYREAEPLFAHILDARTRAAPPDDEEVLLARNNLAETLQAAGRYRQAETLLRSNHAARLRTQGEAHPDTLLGLNNLAALLALRGQFDEAERMHRRVIALQQAAPATAASALLTSLVNLAVVLNSQGRHADASALHRQVVELRTRTDGDLHPSTLAARENLASSLYAEGRYVAALEILQTTIDDARRALGAEHPLTLAAMDTGASALAKLGRFAAAEDLHRRVYSARLASLGKAHPDTLLAMNDLAASLHGSGGVAEATRLFAAVVEGSDAALGELHPISIRLRTNQARYLLDARRWQLALDALRALEPRLRGSEEYAAARARDSDRLRALDREDAEFVDLVLTLAVHAPDVGAGYGADVIVRTKYLGAETDAVVAHAARTERDPAVVAIAQRVREQRAFIARAAHRVGRDDTNELHRVLDALEADEATLARHSHAFAQVREHATAASAKRIAAMLPPGALLLDVRGFRDDLQADPALALRYAVAAISADGTIDVRDLGPIATTRDAIRAAADLTRLIDDDTHAAARALYAALFGGLDDAINAAGAVYLSPDGPLHGVPFNALVLPDGRYWIERQPLHVLASSRSVLRPQRVHAGDGLLAIGGVDYGAGGAQPAFVPLPGSRREAEALHARWLARGLSTQMWTAGGATERALKTLPVAPDYLHLATHGFFSEGPESAHLPLVASGLALAGANLRAANSDALQDDGILYAEEVLDLPLQGTELVVLSACETARGVDANWEGSLGLVRAMRTAGARNVVSTLWQISDEFAVPFMQDFYEQLLQDPQRDVAAALRATQLQWIASDDAARNYPENWAPYVLVQER